MLIFRKSKAKVSSEDIVTAYFQIQAGVMQGDTLALFLFVIVLDYALHNTINGHEAELGFTIDPRISRHKSLQNLCVIWTLSMISFSFQTRLSR